MRASVELSKWIKEKKKNNEMDIIGLMNWQKSLWLDGRLNGKRKGAPQSSKHIHATIKYMYGESKELSVSLVIMLVFPALPCICHYYRQQYLKQRNEPRVKCIYTINLNTHWISIGFVLMWMQRAICHIHLLLANITFLCHPYRMPSMSKNHYWSRTQKKPVDGWQSITPS